MLSAVFIGFFALLLLGVPIALVVLFSAGIGIVGDGVNPVILMQQVFEGTNKFTLLAVPFFIISGDIAAKGKTSTRIINTISAFLGHIHGGLGIATIIACTFFGAITGSAIATVVAIGALMLPTLLERGYPRPLIIGIITSAGTLGVMIPPSVPMLSVSIAMQTSVSRQFTAGFLPGVLTAGAFSLYVWFVCKRKGIAKEPRKTFRERLGVLKDSALALMFPVIVLGSIYSGIATPTEAAVVSLAYVIVVELCIYHTFSVKELYQIIAKSSVSAASLTVTVAMAQVFVWYLATARVPNMLYDLVTNLFSSTLTLYFALCLLFFVVGCFTNVSTVVLILGPILLNVLMHYNIDLIQFVIVVIMMAQIGFITPPFGLCLFVTMKVAKSPMEEVVRATMPFLFIMLGVTVLLVIFPSIATFLPNLIFG